MGKTITKGTCGRKSHILREKGIIMIVTEEIFSNAVEELLLEDENIDPIEAVLTVCSKMNLYPELTANLINPQIKEKLRSEFIRINYLPKENHAIV
jgi:hypothetical protein